MSPSLTVLMPVYNAGAYVGEAIKSILTQDFRDFEFLVIDNASTDNSTEVIATFKDPRIRVYRTEKNLGPPGAINLGLKWIESEYFARMDADDIALPGRLAAQMSLLKSDPGLVLVGTQRKTINGNGHPRRAPSLPVRETDLYWKMMFNSPFMHSSVVARTSLVRSLGGYDERLRYAADFDLWSRIARDRHRLTNLREVYMLQRLHPGQDGSAAGSRRLLEEAATVCQENIRHLTQLDISREEVFHLLCLLDWNDRCPPDKLEGALHLLNRIAANYPRGRSRFYTRTRIRLALLGKELPWRRRLSLLLT